MKASSLQADRKLGREPGSSPGAYSSRLPDGSLETPSGSPTLPGLLALHCALGSQCEQEKDLAGEVVSSTHSHTCKHTVYACLSKVTLKKGDLCQHRETNLHATVCSSMGSGKSWHITFFVSSHVHIMVSQREMSCCGIKGCGFF